MADTPSRKLAVILHADVVGSTTLVKLNETLAHERIRDTFRRLSEKINDHNGIAHEIRGDALVAEFARASDTVSAALAFQVAHTEYIKTLADDICPEVRIGIAMGEVVIADNTVTGEGVVLAQRLEQLAEAGGIVIQGAAYETVPKRLPFDYENLGECELKGFDEPVKAYAVTLRPGSNLPGPESQAQQATRAQDSPDKPSIAVLPFANMSGDPEQEYFSDGITEDIITALSRIRWFLVISRNSVFTYKGRAEDVRIVAEQLGVRYVLEGSVRRSGSRVRVTAQLIDGSTGNQVWANRYDRNLEDIFAVQDELTETIVGALEPEMGKAERERTKLKRPENLDAWDFYQRGLSHLYRVSKEDLAQAHQLFRDAIVRDPNLGLAYAGVAETYYFTLVYGYSDSPEEDRKSALLAAKKAVELDDEDAAAHCTLGRIYYVRREHDLAIEELQIALSLNPSLAWAHYSVGASLVFSGRAEEAAPHLATAIRLSPRDPNMGSFLVRTADAHLFMHNFEESVVWAKKALRQPNFQWSRYAVLLSALGYLGRQEEAQRTLAEVLKERPDFSIEFVRSTHLIADAGDMTHYLEGLRKAGVSE
ncbi:MAG: adenylate/guanylate cyclase domain-containing protein [Arenicellales bacterium]|nr:adenylate/guanylate cyclase domain-containing protein [Arenicellales bacterium]